MNSINTQRNFLRKGGRTGYKQPHFLGIKTSLNKKFEDVLAEVK